ncbi:ROK family protein [Streptomyces sp. NPDC057411]|uniref:ROK family protein n=1 Tax=unclassified Streptomyces TaxID=2593676 RepID=UPI0036407C7E
MFRHHSRPLVSAPAETAVLSLLLTEGPLSRVELARRTGLSPTAVTKAARPLIDDGYLYELPPERTAPGAGRPVSPLAVAPDREFFVGIKVSPDHLFGAVCDLRAGIRVTASLPLADCSPETVPAGCAELLDRLLHAQPEFRDRTRHIGVAVSGDVERETGRVRHSGLLGWHDVPLGELLTAATGLAVTVENDVRALTVAEHWFGAGIGTGYFALVTIGAGIGSALVVGGELLRGAYGVAGEVGHLCVDPEGPPCRCGAHGCVEALASTQAILEAVRTATGRQELDFGQVVDMARAGDPTAYAAFARAGRAIGVGIASLVNLVGPERVVVSGEGLAAYDLFGRHIKDAYTAHAFGAASRCPLSLHPLPWEEWSRGAAAVAIQALFPQYAATATTGAR